MTLSLIIFLLIFTGGITLTIAVDLSWGIALYELLYFIFPVKRWWYTLPQFRFTFFLAVILIIIYFFKNRENFFNIKKIFPQEKILLLMIGLMSVIYFYAIWPEEHLKFLQLQIQQFVFMYIAYRVIDSEYKFDRVLWAYIAGCFYIGYIAQGLRRDSSGRMEGIGMPDGPDANTTAAVLITAIPILLHYLINGTKIQKIISIVFIAFVVNAIILLNSRGAIMAISISIAYFISALLRQKILSLKIKTLSIGFVLISICLFLYLADATFWNRMNSLGEVKVGEGGATRVHFWITGLRMALDHPFGLGARGFEFMSPQLLPSEWLSSSGTIAEHNTYVQALVEFGFMGGVLMAGFIISTFIQTNKIKKLAIFRNDSKQYIKSLAFETSFMSFLIASFFINRLYAEVFYWMMLFVATLENIYSRKYEPKSTNRA